MRYSMMDGRGLHWRQNGDPAGPVVVFSNSLGTDLRLWDEVIAQMPNGLRMIRYDMRGHGLSDMSDTPFGIDDLADDVARLLDDLNVSSAVFVGTSIGGMIGQSLATRRADLLRGLVLTNTAVQMGTPEQWEERIKRVEAGGVEAIVEDILPRWFGPRFLACAEVRAWGNMLRQTSREGYIGCCAAIVRADLTATASSLKLPVCVVAGSDDLACPPSAVKATADLIAGAGFHCLDGVGHLPSVEAPKDLAHIIIKFMQETSHG